MNIRTILVAILLALGITEIKAQQTHVIEPAVMEVNYHVIFGHNYDDYALRIGKNVSQFFSYNKLRFDSLSNSDEASSMIIVNEMLEKSKKLNENKDAPVVESPGYGDYLYTGLCKDSISVYCQIMFNNFRIVEPNPVLNWNICEDSTRLIMGFTCHLATVNFRGRLWKAWYTEEIPVMQGPWKLHGLPGLILCAEVDGFVSFTAVGIKTDNVTPVTFYNFWRKKFEDIERTKYLKKMKTSYPKGTKINVLELE